MPRRCVTHSPVPVTVRRIDPKENGRGGPGRPEWRRPVKTAGRLEIADVPLGAPGGWFTWSGAHVVVVWRFIDGAKAQPFIEPTRRVIDFEDL